MAGFFGLCFGIVLAVSGASSLVATEVIRAGEPVTFDNAAPLSGSAGLSPLIGREVRRTVYAGQQIDFDDTQSPRLVTRNQVVTLRYQRGAVEITVQGRAMGDASLHEPVKVLNLQSRKMVHGVAQEGGWVLVQ